MQTKDVAYSFEGTTYIGYMAVPDGEGKRPGVLVCHEGPGLDDHAKRRARMLADLGYVAFALDYHGGGKPLAGGMPEIIERLGPMIANPLLTRQIGQLGLDVLTNEPRTDTSRLAAIGYCFGGTMSLELARGGAPLAAVVGFHSGLGTARPMDAANISGKVLVCIGVEDPLITAAERAAFEAEMNTARVDWRMNLYGGAAHSFTNEQADLAGIPGIAYHAPTDARSWRAMLDFFDEIWG